MTRLGEPLQKVNAGPPAGNEPPKGFQTGGPSGGIFRGIPPGSFAEADGPATVRLLRADECIVSLVRTELSRLLARERLLCMSCRKSLEEIEGILAELMEGEPRAGSLEIIRVSCERLKTEAHCEVARRAVNPVLTSLSSFRDEYEAHAIDGRCPARRCPGLIQPPCREACPAGIDIPSYLAFMALGQHKEALDVIREENPFAWVCGLICPHPCEKVCVRGHLDAPLNIRYLKAFAAEWTMKHSSWPTPRPEPPNGRKVAVVGSGPSGLSAAHFLALRGYAVTVFEGLPVPGGLLMTGIPEYRLPRWIVEKEIESIRSLGVEIRTGVLVGRDVSLDELRSQGYEAFFLGIGAHKGHRLGIEGEDAFSQVIDAITFLRESNLGTRRKPADKVVVVGGGNSAMDAARTCVRLGCEEVHVAYRRTRREMPANPQEIEEAIEEGVVFHFLAVPVGIAGSRGQVTHLECLRAELGQPDAGGRRRPIPVEGSNFMLEAGAVIAAIGQQPDLTPFLNDPPARTTPRNLIVVEPHCTQTGTRDVFAGGDAVTGPATVVQAIAGGKQASLDIDRFLSGATGTAREAGVHRRRKMPPVVVSADEKVSAGRIPVPMAPPDKRRRNFEAVEIGYSEFFARKEAARCMRCDICIRCGTCEKVCREEMKLQALVFNEIEPGRLVMTDFQGRGNRCIACGACAAACPTGAMQLVDTAESRELRLCGTILNRLHTLKCDACGGPFVPERYLDFVTGRADSVMEKRVVRRLCPACARQKRAEEFALIRH